MGANNIRVISASDLLQLMRLVDTGKVNDYLQNLQNQAIKYGQYSNSAKLLDELEKMFRACQRDASGVRRSP